MALIGIWESETVDFTSLRTPGPHRQEIYGWCGWGFYTDLQSMGRTKHKFPGYRDPGVRSEVKLTQLVVEK